MSQPASKQSAGLEARRQTGAVAPGGPARGYGGPATGLLALQDAAGNHAASQLLQPGETASTPDGNGLPPIVRSVLNSGGGQPLDPTTRAEMESRFGHDFSQVRVHADGRAPESARAVNAHAYTVGSDIVFDTGQYAPESIPGRTLLAHELAHVVQQGRGGTQPPSLVPHGQSEQAAQQAAVAFMQGRGVIPVAGAYARGLSCQPRSLSQTLNPQSLSDTELEKEAWLLQQWLSKQTTITDPERERMVQALNQLENEAYRRHKAAKAPKNPLIPYIKSGSDRQRLIEAMGIIQSITQVDNNIYTVVIDSQTKQLTQTQVDEAYRKARFALKDALTQVKLKAEGAESSYNGLSEMDKKQWIVSRIVKFIGDIKDPGPFLLAEVSKARTKTAAAEVVLNNNNFKQAAVLLVEAESAAIRADRMYRGYWKDIIGAGEMTVTVLEYTRDASFIALAVLATIATAGAAAGATSVFGLELGATTGTINLIATTAPIVAEVGEAGLKVAYGEKVDWGKLAVDVSVNIFLQKFGGKIATNVVSKLAAQNPAIKTIGRHVGAGIVTGIITGAAFKTFAATVGAVYDQCQGKPITWDQFTDRLIAQLADPKGLLFDTLMGALAGAAGAKADGARAKAADAKPSATPKPTGEPTPSATESRQTSVPTAAEPVKTVPAKPTSEPTPSATEPSQTAAPTAAEPVKTVPAKPTPPAAAKPVPVTKLPALKDTESTFAALKKELKPEEAKGPAEGQKLGQGAKGPTKPPQPKPPREMSTKEKVLMEKMAKERLEEGLKKLEDVPDLKQTVETSKVTMADGKTTLRDLAADEPHLIRDAWNNWKAKRASGEIKTADFGEYVKKRQREFRGAGGELTEAFARGPNEIMVKAPKADVKEPGTDMIMYNKQDDRIKLIDNKAFETGATVSKVPALEQNLAKNLGDDIVQVEAYSKQSGVPSEIENTVLPRLRAAKADLDAYLQANPGKKAESSEVQKEFARILGEHKIDRVVTTSGGGRDIKISKKLKTEKGFTQE